MSTTLIFILILSVTIVIHELGHFLAARRIGVRVEKFSLGFGHKIFKKKKGSTEYCLSLIPLGGYVKLAGDEPEDFHGKSDEYLAQGPGKRFWIIFFGPFFNYILSFLIFWMIFFLGYPTLTNKVGGLLDGYGAKQAGIEVQDVITAVDGKKVYYWEELQRQIREHKDLEPVVLTVDRQGKVYDFKVSIKETKVDDQIGSKRKLGLVGIIPADEIIEIRHGFLASFILGLDKTWELTELTYKALWRILTGKLSAADSMTGPLGIFMITSKVANFGFIPLLHLVAVLSLSLAIFNLLPLPVLDGGHIFFLGLEKLRGKALSVKVERLINQVGMSLIIGLALFATYNDIVRNFGEKIGKFLGK